MVPQIAPQQPKAQAVSIDTKSQTQIDSSPG